MTASTFAYPLVIAPSDDDETARRIVRRDPTGDRCVGFVLAEYAGLFKASPSLLDAARTAMAAIEAAFPIAIPDSLAHAYNRLYEATKDAQKGEMRV